MTKETIKGSEFINNLRKENHLEPLEVFITGLINNSNNEDKISSGDIRKSFIEKIENQKNIIEFLKKTWVQEIYNDSNEISEIWLDKLMCNYMEKWRLYHNLLHIYDMLRLFEEFKAEIKERRRVFLAIWFHDAVYWPGDGENEEVFILN